MSLKLHVLSFMVLAILFLFFFINPQKNCGLLPTNCLIVFDHFVVLVLKGLSHFRRVVISLPRENIKKENSCFSVFSAHITKSKKFRYKKFRTEGWSANINARNFMLSQMLERPKILIGCRFCYHQKFENERSCQLIANMHILVNLYLFEFAVFSQ